MSVMPADFIGVENPSPEASARAATTHPRRISRRRWLRGLAGGAAMTLAGGAYGSQIEPFWLDRHDVPMPLPNLPPSFEGFRIVQLTDLHASTDVPMSFLRDAVDGVRAQRPDLVVVTGDLVSHSLEFVDAICDVLGRIKCPVIVTFGNHDYDVKDLQQVGALGAVTRVPTRVADQLEAALGDRNITVLRNRAVSIDHHDGRIWFVGMEDVWSGRFSPQVAFAGVDRNDPVIALSHNPDTALEVDGYCPDWILAGHTHGGQIRVPGYGAVMLNIQNTKFQQGQFKLGHSSLYVSRGVGYLKRLRLFCRPEIPCFVLESKKG